MANDATLVRVGAGGKIYGGGSSLPTDATTTPHVSFNDYGYASDKGVVLGRGTTVNKIKAWGGDVVRTVRTEDDVTVKLEFLETNAYTLAAYTGDTAATATAAVIANVTGIRQKWLFDVIDGDYTIRVVVPDGEVTETGDLPFVTDSAVLYPVTITCYPDGSGNKAYLYIDSGA